MKSNQPKSLIPFKRNKEAKLDDYLKLLAENKIALTQLSKTVEKTSKDIDNYIKKQQEYFITFLIV